MIDKLICEDISNSVPDNDVAVLLSGGVDSISVALAAEKLGKNIHTYSFYLDNYENYEGFMKNMIIMKKNHCQEKTKHVLNH